jgi:hypothetical protein
MTGTFYVVKGSSWWVVKVYRSLPTFHQRPFVKKSLTNGGFVIKFFPYFGVRQDDQYFCVLFMNQVHVDC